MRKNKKYLQESICSSANKQQQVFCMDNWKQPEWLREITDLVDRGDFKKAAEAFTEEFVEKHIEAASMPAKGFIMVASARLLKQMRQAERADNLYKQLLKLCPNNTGVINEMAATLQEQGKFNQATRFLNTAVEKNPNEPLLCGNLGLCLMPLGHTDDAIALMRKAADKAPDNNHAHSNLLMSMHYLPETDRPMIFEESKKWAQRNLPQRMARTNHKNTPDPERKLKIGYISPDFRKHSVTYFFEPLLDAHNRDAVEVYGYGNIHQYDDTTTRLKSKFDHYRNIRPLDDKATAELIENDGIDILVDLAGHSANSRIYAMAYKPAPIQVTWLGYPDTTGMSQIDYRFTDSIADPPGSEKFYTEKLFYLPDGFLCFGPDKIQPPVAPLPFLQNKHITFGCFNNSRKINPVITGLWARILKQVPNSKLLLKFESGQDDEIREMFMKRFEDVGISSDRITISGRLPSPAHLELYNQVDIALDTFPYNGTTTTCQSLLMGVPVINLVGEHHMSRVGLSILTSMGLEFFAASRPDEYVEKAVALASKPDALAKIRSAMRARMAVSPLCNRVKFAENIERAYRQMWHRWCESQGINTQKQKTPSAACDATPLSDSKKLSNIAQLAVKVDTLCRTGHQAQARPYASEGWNRLNNGEKAGDIPPEILKNWDARTEEILFIRFCVSLNRYSSFYDPLTYMKLFSEWAKRDVNNPLPYFRLGLAMALAAKAAGLDTPPKCLETLRYADKLMQNEMSAAALALAQGNIRELSLPYDGGRINLYPDLRTLTTYVLLEQGDWFEDELALFRNLIRPQDKVLDLGANIGVYAISAALRTSRQGRVIAVEPAMESFKLLKASAKAFSQMTAVHAGVSDKNGAGWLCHGNSSEMNMFGEPEQKGEKADMFSVDGLAEKMKVNCFDIIKMDVEGYEQKVLEGAGKIIGENSPIIFYEFKLGSDYNFKLIDAFAEMGYDSYCYIKGTSTLIKVRKGMEFDGRVLNLVAFRPESIERIEKTAKISTESDCPEILPANFFLSYSYLRHNQRRQEHLASLGLDIAGSTVLEVGAGIGDHTSFFLDRQCQVLSTEARYENLKLLRSRYPNIEVMHLDLDCPITIEKNFDIVYCYGLLYHLEKPAEAIEFMARHCRNMLLLETCVSFDDGESINPCKEPVENPTQSASGNGCRPSRKWVFNQLKRHFKFVYMPLTQPNHEQFPIDWTSPPSTNILTRSIFIASRHKLDNNFLVEDIPMQQKHH